MWSIYAISHSEPIIISVSQPSAPEAHIWVMTDQACFIIWNSPSFQGSKSCNQTCGHMFKIYRLYCVDIIVSIWSPKHIWQAVMPNLGGVVVTDSRCEGSCVYTFKAFYLSKLLFKSLMYHCFHPSLCHYTFYWASLCPAAPFRLPFLCLTAHSDRRIHQGHA